MTFRGISVLKPALQQTTEAFRPSGTRQCSAAAAQNLEQIAGSYQTPQKMLYERKTATTSSGHDWKLNREVQTIPEQGIIIVPKMSLQMLSPYNHSRLT